MYQYTNNSMSSFNKGGSYHSLPETYYPSSQQQQQQQQQQQNYGWYPQQSMTAPAATSAPILAPPPSITPPPPPPTIGTTHTADAPPSPPLLTNANASSRPKITTSLWEDEGTICYQVDSRGICVARRQDNDMINGTKLLNVTGMSRGKRDGILKNEKGRVVVKVGAMHLKGVWVTFSRAKTLAIQHNIKDILHPLFVDDPAIYFYSNPMAPPHANFFIPTSQQQQQQQGQQPVYVPQNSGGAATSITTEEIYSPHRHAQQASYSTSTTTTATTAATTPSSSMDHLPSARAVPSMAAMSQQDYYAYREQNSSNNNINTPIYSNNTSLQSVDHLDQQSLLDYASKGSASMFSLTISDSSPATPSQQSLFYDPNMAATAPSFPPSPHLSSMDHHPSYQPQQQQQQQHNHHHRQQQQQHKLSHPPVNKSMTNLPIAPTLPSNTPLDSSFYYTHPCVSTTSFHDHPPLANINSDTSLSPTAFF
ncbi:hypothetical protein [Absidia glauca]|uniref:HTH APSES-type domain-containing protein n=1 Tax=Absidia glauca TaxID=4829 RepID=A0A163IRI7_ABSGL|nr:hypothetical protein [Absidia glauca]